MSRIFTVAIAAALLISCGSDKEPSSSQPGLLDPPPAGQGLQYKMVSTIDPGQEIERCQFFEAPEEGLNINSEKIRYTPGSHHVLLYATRYTEIPTRTVNGVELDTSGVVDCAEGATADWDVTGVVSGSQSSEGAGIVGTLPAGVAVKVDPGTVLLMNTHYLNATLSPLVADARINLYTIPQAEVQHEAGVLFYYNPFIRVGAGASASAEMRCPVWQDMNIISVQSHMHARGVGFKADLVRADGTRREIYTNTEWENVPAERFDPVLEVKAGEALQYRCDYQNSEQRVVTQGGTTRDEMCMLLGPYYPRDLRLENCLDAQGNFAAAWTGSGAATCGDTLTCIMDARSDGDFYGCVVDSCPNAAPEMNDVVQCLMTDAFGACSEPCATNGDCQGCILGSCSTIIDSCQAASCG